MLREGSDCWPRHRLAEKRFHQSSSLPILATNSRGFSFLLSLPLIFAFIEES